MKKSPSLALSVLLSNVYGEKGELGAARRSPFACLLSQGFANQGRETLPKRPVTPRDVAGIKLSNRPAEPSQGPIWPNQNREKVHRAVGEGLFHEQRKTRGAAF